MANFGKKVINGGAALGVVFASLLVGFGISLIFAIPVWLLWNWLMPMIFGLTKLTLVQAWGVTFLANCLFKSVSNNKE